MGGLATAAGRFTGLLSADLLLIQVLLMARIPWVERVWGQDQLTKRHRLVGFTSFWLMWVHNLLITVGYAQAAHRNLIAEGWNLILQSPGMLLAAAGTLALIAVVVTSIRRARRRLRYASWHLIHLYAYLGVGLALPHQLWTGQDFLAFPLATIHWWGLWGAAAGAILYFREGTERLAGIRPGTRVHFEGPYGTMTADRRTRRDVLLIGAGVGITPMRGLAEAISREGAPESMPSVVVITRPTMPVLPRSPPSSPNSGVDPASASFLSSAHGAPAATGSPAQARSTPAPSCSR